MYRSLLPDRPGHPPTQAQLRSETICTTCWLRRYIVPVKLPQIDHEVPVVGNVVALSETPAVEPAPPPLIAEHTAEVMRGAGFDEAAVARVMAHTKEVLLANLGGNERVAKRMTAHVKEYWGEEAGDDD